MQTKNEFKRLCVYCGSSLGNNPRYREAAKALGEQLLDANIGLVYGGASVGLMGIIADTVRQGDGEVIGVIPQSIVDLEVAHEGLTELHVVSDMHQRKAMMMSLADGFIALPGGLGTLEEIFEALTWWQLRLHRKPCGLLNIDNYYQSLRDFLAHAIKAGFVKAQHVEALLVDSEPRELLSQMYQFNTVSATKL